MQDKYKLVYLSFSLTFSRVKIEVPGNNPSLLSYRLTYNILLGNMNPLYLEGIK
jgi:hypothetical protein